MGRRIDDLLVLASRVQERRGDIRVMVRQDPAAAGIVLSYLDDLSWLSKQAPVQPRRASMATAKAQLLASLEGPRRRRPLAGPTRVVGAAATATVLLGLTLSARATTEGVPQPVAQVLSRVFDTHQANATPHITIDGGFTRIDPSPAPDSRKATGDPSQSSTN